jgi:hypothetical protein
MRLAGWRTRSMVDRYTAAASAELALADYRNKSPVDAIADKDA